MYTLKSYSSCNGIAQILIDSFNIADTKNGMIDQVRALCGITYGNSFKTKGVYGIKR